MLLKIIFYKQIKMLSGLKDIDREILKHIDDGELLNVCSINRKFWYEICDDNFIRRRLMRYPDIEKYRNNNETWKQFFLTVTYYIFRMKENKTEYKGENFKNQYHLSNDTQDLQMKKASTVFLINL